MSRFEKIINKAIKDPKNILFTKYKVSPKNVHLIKEASDIKKKYGRNTTRAEAIKKGYKRKKFVSSNNNYKSLLGS
jgi:hypothetical protein